MKDFFTKKREYLENLHSNEILLKGIQNNQQKNTPEIMRIIFDPKTEEELSTAISITTIFGDSINMFSKEGNTQIEDISKEPIVDLFRRLILAVRDNNVRILKVIRDEVKQEKTPEILGELAYKVLKVFGLNAEEAFIYLATQCSIDLNDADAAEKFNAYFSKANELFNQMMPSVEVKGKLDLNNKELITYYSRFASSFHKAYQKDFEPKQGLKK